DLPSVGTIKVHHPLTGKEWGYRMPGEGRGYTRTPSLIGLWSTAPFLLNNSVGKFNPSPSVDARMQSFQNSIEQMLWPEKRDTDRALGEKIPGVIDRTTAMSYLRIPKGYLPDVVQDLEELNELFLPTIFGEKGIEIGPIPAGTPVNLLANLNLLLESTNPIQQIAHQKKVLKLLFKIKHDLERLPKGASDEEARKVWANVVDPLLELNKCPDFVVNRGHYFGTSVSKEEPGLSDEDKRALIEFVRTF
nr:hypothetical protein [Nitrospirales bacterium]